MNKKTLKRVLYAVVAVAFLFVAGREFATVGMNVQAVAAGGAGLFLAVLAITGAG